MLRVQSRHATSGASVEMLLRPENVRLLEPGDTAGADNVVDAVVSELSFVGGRTRVEAVVGDERLLATRISARHDTMIQPGQPVRLAWSAADSVVLS